jgi:integrase/recombinase XerD
MAKHTRKRTTIVDSRLRWLTPHIGGFRSWLEDQDYSTPTIVEVVRLLSLWADWSRIAGFDFDTLPAGVAASDSVFRGGRTARAPQGAAKLFLAYLREQGVLPQAAHVPSATETWPILGAFRAWMGEQRGVAHSTLDTYQTVLVHLLATLGDDPRAYTAVAVRAFVLERGKAHGRGRAQGVAVATRAFLRYLIATGRCPIGRDQAVPGFASWRLATTPRFLPMEAIDRVLAACDGEDRLRDKAVVLLLARLGLRASEVANLAFPRIDWKAGRLTVLGKSRREERLPLTQEVGDAIIAYVERARPPVATSRVFLTMIAPVEPLSRVAVKCIVARAMDRAGVESPHRGAHVMRHSAATAMLRNGVSLAGVGAVLRHRSPSTTALYAKVDIALLSEVAQPWGGRLPC